MNARDMIPGKTPLRLPVRRLAATAALLTLPLAAWADDDEKPVPIDPKTAATQNQIMGVVVLLAVLAVAWYYVRRWQITRSGNQVYGTNRNQD